MREKIAEWKEKLGVTTNTELAALLGMSSMAVGNWYYGKSKPSGSSQKLINLLIEQKKNKKGNK